MKHLSWMLLALSGLFVSACGGSDEPDPRLSDAVSACGGEVGTPGQPRAGGGVALADNDQTLLLARIDPTSQSTVARLGCILRELGTSSALASRFTMGDGSDTSDGLRYDWSTTPDAYLNITISVPE